MKKIYFSFLLFGFLSNLSAQVIASERVIDGLCELYYERDRAGGYSSARAINKRIHDYRTRFGLQEFDERECGFSGNSRSFDRGYESGYMDSYYDRRYWRHHRDSWGNGWGRDDGNGWGRGTPQNPWND